MPPTAFEEHRPPSRNRSPSRDADKDRNTSNSSRIRETKRKKRDRSLSPSSSSSDSESSGDQRHKRIRHSSKSKRHHKRHGQDDTSSPSQSSDSDSPHTKHKRSVKSKKHKSDRSRSKKHKQKKKTKAKSHKSDENESKAVTGQWGKYGHIQECDRWTKKQEFQLWLLEIKNKALEDLSQWEERELFKDFVEDYNTATMPSKKFYCLATWEKKQAAKSAKRKWKESLTRADDEKVTFNDERDRRYEIESIRDQRRQICIREELESFKIDSEKVDAMKKQNVLKNQMQILFKMGRHEEATKIQELLAPDPLK